MPLSIHTAVAVAALPAERSAIARLLAFAGIDLLDMPLDGVSAWDSLLAHRPDLLLAMQTIPGAEGASLIERAIGGFRLPVRPKAILLNDARQVLPANDHLRALGAVVLESGVSCADFCAAVHALEAASPLFPPRARAHAEKLLDAIGIPPHIGRDFLSTAALLCAADERCRGRVNALIYAELATIYTASVEQVQHAMRHAIELAWKSDQYENQDRLFANAIDVGRGQPTCGEMISRLADILRLEG